MLYHTERYCTYTETAIILREVGNHLSCGFASVPARHIFLVAIDFDTNPASKRIRYLLLFFIGVTSPFIFSETPGSCWAPFESKSFEIDEPGTFDIFRLEQNFI